MAPKFGTSGLRGLVTELTDDLVAAHVGAFVAACDTGGTVFVGRDLRASSPRIAQAVVAAALGEGQRVIDAGPVPTPALALAAGQAGAAAVMVTGSHIPADRNGLKFYTVAGEITKDDEARIGAELGRAPGGVAGEKETDAKVGAAYLARYLDAYGTGALADMRIGVWQHSSVARDLLVDLLSALGATPVPVGRSEEFVPIDTEAIDADTRARIAAWVRGEQLDALVSTDGDADRPLLADGTGRILPGDILGPLAAQALDAKVLCTPVSSNSLVAEMGFDRVLRTRIGSPFVIAAMEEADGDGVVGYEASGGFLLGFAAEGPSGQLAPLRTRDAVLPMLAVLHASREGSISKLVADLPQRFATADRVAGIAPERSADFLATLLADADARAGFFSGLGKEASIDTTDGLRARFASGEIVHLRPSGNAPEFRCYAEAASEDRARELVRTYLARAAQALA